MAEAVVGSTYRQDILYFLATYPEEAKKIALMDPINAVKKIAEIEGRFTAKYKANISKAPKAVNPLKSNQVSSARVSNIMDLDKIAKTGSQEDFEKAVRALNKTKAW